MNTNQIAGLSTVGFSGAALAVMAAGLSLSSPATAAGAKAAAGEVALVHCSGVNQCKGHNDCKTASNACKGQGSCKGQGFVAASAEACGNLVGGTVIDPGQGLNVAVNSQIHCYGINQCKGHNDCKTASNACKGQGSCKGQGFVALPSASCGNAGGKTSAA
ncbi:MAG: BufA2 family periplasmic bufferin-type metallophore [Luteimonas sp.]